MDDKKQKFGISRASTLRRDKPLNDDRLYSEARTWNGYPDTHWYIDLTPSELLELCKAEEQIIVYYSKDGDYWHITIYDDYVE